MLSSKQSGNSVTMFFTGGETRDGVSAVEIPDVNFDTTQMPVHLQLFNVLLQVEVQSILKIVIKSSLYVIQNIVIMFNTHEMLKKFNIRAFGVKHLLRSLEKPLNTLGSTFLL